jgi:hypothetical protein
MLQWCRGANMYARTLHGCAHLLDSRHPLRQEWTATKHPTPLFCLLLPLSSVLPCNLLPASTSARPRLLPHPSPLVILKSDKPCEGMKMSDKRQTMYSVVDPTSSWLFSSGFLGPTVMWLSKCGNIALNGFMKCFAPKSSLESR